MSNNQEWGTTRACGQGRDAGRIRRFWCIVELCGIGALVVLFNLYPERIGVLFSATDPNTFVPLLAPEFQAHMAWLNVCWGLALLLAAVKLICGRWTQVMRWTDLGLSVLGVYVLGRLVFGGPIVGLNPRWVAASSASLDRFGREAIPLLNIVVKFVLGCALAAVAIASVEKLARLLARAPFGVWDVQRVSRYTAGILKRE